MKENKLPTRDELIEFIESRSGNVHKRDVNKYFGIKGNDKITIKKMIKSLQEDGIIKKGKGKSFSSKNSLPEYCICQVKSFNEDGQAIAVPLKTENNYYPEITITDDTNIKSVIKAGDKFLLKITKLDSGLFYGKTVRRIQETDGRFIIGIFESDDNGDYILPANKKEKDLYRVTNKVNAEKGDIIRAEFSNIGRGEKALIVSQILCKADNPKTLSMISVFENDIPNNFPDDVEKEAKEATEAPMGKRTDLTNIPFVTIDGADAKDFDDAVWAEEDKSPDNKGGWHIIVAIADIAHYVKQGSALDKEAYKRGNSVYLPDMVIPMLPNELSTNLCSLRPMQDRPVMAVHIHIDEHGNKIKHKFVRAMIRSVARLTYTQVQNAIDEIPDPVTEDIADTVIKPLYQAYLTRKIERKKRKPLNIDVPERKVKIDDEGNVVSISPRERYESHKLIEEFMILANVCAAEELEKHKAPVMYRIHDIPTESKVETLHNVLKSLGISSSTGKTFEPEYYNKIMYKSKGTEFEFMISNLILRSQCQAQYSPDNIGHFGLNLPKYAHFTSPIRRYADLLVHRSLISALKLGQDGLSKEYADDFSSVGEHISLCEKRAMEAERNAVERYLSLYLTEKIGAVFQGRISGVSKAGVFVTLTDTGAEGLVPRSSLPHDYYIHEPEYHRLYGEQTGRLFKLGDEIEIKLTEVTPVSGGLIFKLIDDNLGINYKTNGNKKVKAKKRSSYKKRK